MDEDDFCYLFDTFGHVVLPNVLGADELATLNAAVDRHLDDDAGWFEYLYADGTTGYAPADRATPLAGSMGYSIGKDAPSMLSWPEPRDRDPFRKLMHHPELCRSMNALCGRGFRLDHPPSLRIYNPRPAGAAVSDDAPLNLHGSSGPDFNPHEYYVVRNGRMHSGLTVVAWQLADIGPGDGGFGLIPGSHKGNFPCPPAMRRGEAFREHVHQPVCKAGDCVIFTEALTHTTLPWRGEHQRRSLLVRYAPANLAYARIGRTGVADEPWEPAMLEGGTPEYLALLEPPYNPNHPLMDRPLLDDDGRMYHLKDQPPSERRPRWAKTRRIDDSTEARSGSPKL